MATAVKNVAGLSMASSGAFNSPVLSSNVQTINLVGTTGLQSYTFPLETGVPLEVQAPRVSDSINPWIGKNIVIQVMDPVGPGSEPQLTFSYRVQTAPGPFGHYDVTMGFTKQLPLVTMIATPPVSTQDPTMSVTLNNPEIPTATIKVLVYGS